MLCFWNVLKSHGVQSYTANLCWFKDLVYTFMAMAFQKCVLCCNILFVRCKTCDIDDYLNIAPDTN